MKKILGCLLVLTLATSLAGIYQTTLAASIFWQSKVDPMVLENATDGETEFIVFLKEQADLSGARLLPTKREKGAYVYEQLTRVARETQLPILASLRGEEIRDSVSYRSYWVANMIWVRGKTDLVRQMAQRSDVAHIYANPKMTLDLPSPSPLPDEIDRKALSPNTVEWNIQRVKAPQVWAIGYNGQGVVVGGQDTGYKWDHPALKNTYRGWDGLTADHNYNWHDAIHSGVGTTCKEDWPEPCDVHGHGTHTMGTIVGDDGFGNQIGMAPGAEWIGCRNMNNQGLGTSITYSECYQWFIAPTDLNDQNPRPDLAPDVINNSWSCPSAEQGCSDVNVLKTVVESVRAAGIVTVHSAGNSGPSCSTVNTPAAIYDASFTVGATDSFDNIVYYSSRGPVTVDGSGRLKPNVTAPGSGIRSSWPGPYSDYYTLSGTSMAGPHVAGLVALLLSAQPKLTGNVDEIENLIEQNATPRTISQICGGIPGTERPNNTFGWGLIDAWATVQNVPHLFGIEKTASAIMYKPGQTITYTLSITHYHPFTPTLNVILTDVLPAEVEFITATLPHTKTGDLFQWGFSTMDPGDFDRVNLVVRIPELAPGVVINQDYGVRSDETPTLLGLPIEIILAKFIYFPLMTNRP
jgi:serine protease AprX